MPPSSGRRTRTRKRLESPDKSDADDALEIETPTRKRRRVNTVTPRQPEPSKAPASLSKPGSRRKPIRNEPKLFEDEENLTQQEVDFVIRHLKRANYDVQARTDFANEVHEVAHPEGKQAYAKIAGNGWTYYVDDLQTRIGRPPDNVQADPHTPGQQNGDGDKSSVHIDLGPSKLVSRQHAEVRFDEHSGGWAITVNGRNGVKVDDKNLGRGRTDFLHSGSVIDIAGTQMMFVTPNENPAVHSTILARIRDDFDEDEDEIDLPPPPRPQWTPVRAPPANGPLLKTETPGRRPINYGSTGYGQFPSSSMPLVQHDGSADIRTIGSQSAQKTSPAYARGLMLESTEDIDYGVDSARDLKPPHSYAQLIGMAILSSPEEKLTLAKIYDWIKERYAFYRFSGGGWQNSIRHNLSLNKCFEKIARRTDEPGKGMKWQIVAEHRDDFIKKGLSSARKGTGHSTGPDSPMYNNEPSSVDPNRRFDNAYARDFHNDPRGGNGSFVKTSPTSTPPVAAYPQMKLAYTPDRGSGRHPLPNGSPRNPFGANLTPLAYGKTRTYGYTEPIAVGTPGGFPMLGGSDANDHLYTPLITRHTPKLAPPSTARLPSQFMPLSSPAPFWKYAADFGSTPSWRDGTTLNLGLDMSPAKSVKGTTVAQGEELKGAGDDKSADADATRVESSSPPPREEEVGQGSPTRALSSRGRDASQALSQTENHTVLPQPKQEQIAPLPPPVREAPPPFVAPAAQDDEEGEEEEEEGMIDLARGFQPIGSFHRSMNAAIIRG